MAETTPPGGDYDIDDDVALHRKEFDPSENLETTPPPDESIRQPAVWITEAFPASMFDDLIANVATLGWANDFELSDVVQFVEEAKTSIGRRAWTNIGTLIPHTRPRRLGGRSTVLPDGVVEARGSIQQSMPSLVHVTLQFILSEGVAATLEEAIRATYVTAAERIGNRTRYRGPDHHKREAAGRARAAIRRRCAHWFRDHLPGYFSKRDGLAMPGCELVTLTKHRPGEVPEKPHDRYLWVLGWSYIHDTWKSDDLPGLRLFYPRDHSGPLAEGRWTLQLVGHSEDVRGEDHPHYSDDDRRRAGLHSIHERFERSLVPWAVWAQSSDYLTHLAHIRAALLNVDVRSQSASSVVAQIQTDFVRLQADLAAFVVESRRWASDRRSYRWAVLTFAPEHPRTMGRSLFENLRTGLLDNLERLDATSKQLEALLATVVGLGFATASAQAADESVRLNKTAVRIAITALLLSMVTLWQQCGSFRSTRQSTQTIVTPR